MIHIFPPHRCLLVRGYQKLSKNNYNNSIFFVKGISSHILNPVNLLCYCTSYRYSRAAERRVVLHKHSAFFPCQASTRVLTLLSWLCPLCMPPPWGWFPVQRVSISSCARITGVTGPGCTARHSKWSKHYRNVSERSGQNHQLECSGLI